MVVIVVKRAVDWGKSLLSLQIFFGPVFLLQFLILTLLTLVITVEQECLLMSIRLLVSSKQQDEERLI